MHQSSKDVLHLRKNKKKQQFKVDTQLENTEKEDYPVKIIFIHIILGKFIMNV